MKKLVTVFVVLCFAVCTAFADTGKVEKLQSEIQQLNKQISELKKTVEFQRAEIARLKGLCLKAGVDPNVVNYADESKNAPPKSPNEITATALSEPIFGVYLGEDISEVRKRLDVIEFNSNQVDVDAPVKNWVVQHHNNALMDTGLIIRTFQNRVYLIGITFKDNSNRNFKSLEQQLSKKYYLQEVSRDDFVDLDRNFVTTLDNVPVQIYLHLEVMLIGDNLLNLQYCHMPLREALESVISNRKQGKVADDL